MGLVGDTHERKGRDRASRYSKTAGRGRLVLIVAVVALAGLTPSASAHTGQWEEFNYCPTGNPETFKCVNAHIYGGEIVLGKKTTPIVNPVTFQSGFSETTRALGRLSEVFAATNGVTLSKTPEPVPGGLLGLVPPSSSPPAIKHLTAYYAEHGLTGVNAVVELAAPVSALRISEFNLSAEEGLAQHLSIKVHLENPFLGSSCYIGSNSTPIDWELTTGSTGGYWPYGLLSGGPEERIVPPPNKPIHGTSGFASLYEEGFLAGVSGTALVDNNWSAPAASGCGGTLAPLVDPLIDAATGLPSPAGRNTAILDAAILLANKAEVIVR
jgi:hypothetical protein